MRNSTANGISAPQIDVTNDGIESKSPADEQDLEEKSFSPSGRQHSMRRSRISGELERDVGQSASSRQPTATSLNPVTPLRWKSSKRLEMKRTKLQEEIKTKEVVKEEMKNSKHVKDENKVQSMMIEVSKLEVNGIESSHKPETLMAIIGSANCEARSGSQRVIANQISEKVRDLKPPPFVTNRGIAEQAKQREDEAPISAERGNDPSKVDVVGTDRKPLAGDESSVITIDFLRARLLAERASSKAAKERIQQLTKKVLELEGKLDQEIQCKMKVEEAAHEALLKFQSIGKQASIESSESSETLGAITCLPEKFLEPNHAFETAMSTLLPGDDEPVSPHVEKKTEQEDQELPNQSKENCQVPKALDEASSNAHVVTMPGDTLSSSLDENDGTEELTNVHTSTPMSEQETGDHVLQSLRKLELQDVKGDVTDTAPGIVSTRGDTIFLANSGLKRQERRFVIEERLRSMWDQMTQEMAALAEDKTQEELVREELLNWMGQVPSVLQDILPKQPEDKKLVTASNTEKLKSKDGNVLPKIMNIDQTQKEDTVEDCSVNGAPYGDRETMQDKGFKKVASLIERFEAQESTQREWEQNNAKQNSIGRRRSNEGSISRTNSSLGTPYSVDSDQKIQQEQSDVYPRTLSQVEDLRDTGHSFKSSVSPRKEMSAGSLLIRNENSKMDIHTSQGSSLSTNSNPPTVGEMVRRSGGEENITHDRTHRTQDYIHEHAQFGFERTLDLSHIMPPLHSTPSGSNEGDNQGDIRNNPVGTLQVPKQSNHYNYPNTGLEGRYENVPGHSARSNIERRELPRSRDPLIGWSHRELEPHTFRVPTNKGDSSLQWNAPSIRLHQQHEKLKPYSQAGNSNAYVRPEVPGNYPLRNDEREIYRGRMESVSRSMEGLGGSWRSLSDQEGDDILPYADVSDSIELGITRRSSLQMPFQVDGGSGRSNYFQADNMVDTSPSFAHSSRAISRENFHSRPSINIESTSSKVNEVLKALHLVKLNIQNTGARRTSISNPSNPTSEHSYIGGEKHNLKVLDYGGDGGGGTMSESPAAIRVWPHQEISRRYSTGTFRKVGSPPRVQPATSSAPFGLLIDSLRKDVEEDRPLAGRSSPVSNAHKKFASKVSTVGGMQYFYPS